MGWKDVDWTFLFQEGVLNSGNDVVSRGNPILTFRRNLLPSSLRASMSYRIRANSSALPLLRHQKPLVSIKAGVCWLAERLGFWRMCLCAMKLFSHHFHLKVILSETTHSSVRAFEACKEIVMCYMRMGFCSYVNKHSVHTFTVWRTHKDESVNAV